MSDIVITDEQIKVDIDPSYHLWRRYFAFYIDISFYNMFFYFIFFGILKWDYDGFGNIVSPILFSIGATLVYLLIDPIVFSIFGTTLGKTIFGFELRRKDGTKLSYKEAFVRTLIIVITCLGVGIPLISMILLIIAYRKAKRGEKLWNEDYDYTLKDANGKRILILILALVIVNVVNVNSYIMSLEVPYRGNLTVKGYARNVNVILKNYNYDVYHKFFGIKMRMNDSGEWEIKENRGAFSKTESKNHFSRDLIVENGYVKGLKLVNLFEDREYIGRNLFDLEYEAEVLALINSNSGDAYFHIFNRELNRKYNEYKQMENGRWDFGNYILTKSTENNGYLKREGADLYEQDTSYKGKRQLRVVVTVMKK